MPGSYFIFKLIARRRQNVSLPKLEAFLIGQILKIAEIVWQPPSICVLYGDKTVSGNRNFKSNVNNSKMMS